MLELKRIWPCDSLTAWVNTTASASIRIPARSIGSQRLFGWNGILFAWQQAQMSEPLLLLDYSTPPTLRPARPLALAGIAVTAVLAGTVIGASTGVIDGTLCPEYFTNALGPRGDTVWQASMLRGAVAGSILGSFLSAFATAIISIITQASCTFKAGLRWLGFVMLGVYGMWMFGGATAVGLAALTPRVCQNLDQRIFRAAWVDGSIWGAEFGGCVVVLIGLGLFDMRWQRMMKLESRR